MFYNSFSFLTMTIVECNSPRCMRTVLGIQGNALSNALSLGRGVRRMDSMTSQQIMPRTKTLREGLKYYVMNKEIA